MAGVRVGEGDLGGRGVYADRDFVAGEPVIVFELESLDEDGYLALPAGDEIFVHSYGGRRVLYPAPARFVNHADDPSCFEDFDRCRDVALRDIAKGEAITIDATQETAHELRTFLEAYAAACRSRSVPDLEALIDVRAVSWERGAAARGREALVGALLASGPKTLLEVEWFVGTGRWEALCSVSTGHGDEHPHTTLLLKVVRGNWQLVYRHVG